MIFAKLLLPTTSPATTAANGMDARNKLATTEMPRTIASEIKKIV